MKEAMKDMDLSRFKDPSGFIQPIYIPLLCRPQISNREQVVQLLTSMASRIPQPIKSIGVQEYQKLKGALELRNPHAEKDACPLVLLRRHLITEACP